MTGEQIMCLTYINQKIKTAQDHIAKYEKYLQEAIQDKSEIMNSCDHLWINNNSAVHYGVCQICEKSV